VRGAAVVLLKIANDLRWMNSGPVAGLAEISLPALQPGSSMMPGKVNPVIPEAVAMACVHIIGNDTALVLAAQSGTFQLNTMLPLIAWSLLTNIRILANSARALETKAIREFTVHRERLAELAARNPILATALVPEIGYDASAKLAQEALASGRSIFEVARQRTSLSEEDLRVLLDPEHMTGPKEHEER
jgi:fumarate hydratase class II